MCGRYKFTAKAKDIEKHYKVEKVPKEIRPNFNVAPEQTMPVITETEDGKHQVELMKWGIPRVIGKDEKTGKLKEKELINTRSDKAFGGFWKRTVLNQRCLIPADGFYEWKATKDGKVPFYIHPKFADLYSFAGIWDLWKNEDGEEIKVYSIMTTEPNKDMKDIHNRMPVILHPEDEASWIKSSNDTPEALQELLFPLEDGALDMYEVSRAVNNPRNNDESIFQPVVA